MAERPNILFLMTDQMIGRALGPDHPCITPNLDRLAQRGVRIEHAYTPNPVCSPARASLMTGRLPHSHGVLQVTHTADKDRNVLRTNLPHFAQRLTDAGYRTGYFGKWHVEHSNSPGDFGWQQTDADVPAQPPQSTDAADATEPRVLLEHRFEQRGYKSGLFYQVRDQSPEHRGVGKVTARAQWFLDQVLNPGPGAPEDPGSANNSASDDGPWCCFVSCTEPHDPFVCGKSAFEQYDVDSIPVPGNWDDACADKPGLYRRAARTFNHLSERQKKEAAACYYAMITEVDEQYGKLLDKIEQAGELDNTIVVFTSDHGEMLGAHGLYMKNVGAFEEAYGIPMVLAGPGVAAANPEANGGVDARVGLHDLCPTLVELAGAEPIDTGGESRSFAPLLREPAKEAEHWKSGYAEYSGGRIDLTQRVLWDGPWKLVFNGFDDDELYNHDDDPLELTNLARDRLHETTYQRLWTEMWQRIHQFNDHALGRMHYPVLRLPPVGPSVGA